MQFSVGFISLGCAKNLVDTQVMAGLLKQGKITLAHSPEEADIILVNTCAFIQDAREEAAEAILSACEQKQSGGCKAVIVTGCMVQRYRSKLVQAFPDVDAFIGVDQLEVVTDVVNALENGKRIKRVFADAKMPIKTYNPVYPTLLFTGGPFSYLKVAEGCDHRCAYCAIPLIRGAFRSRRPTDLLAEAKAMVRAGVKEINLIAQDVLRYGCDLSANGKSKLPALLKKIDELDGDFRWRLLYGYPSEVTDEVLELLASSRHACAYLDLPIQHSHPDVLRAMNRPAAVDAVIGLTERLRRAVPNITVRTTCLVGFPGETESHFQHLLSYVKESAFDHLGVFSFSPEEGTPAFDMDGLPEPEVAEDRRKRLMSAQKKIDRVRKAALVGKNDTALLLQEKGNKWISRLPGQAPDVDGVTLLSSFPATAKSGDFVPVTITGARGYDLLARG